MGGHSIKADNAEAGCKTRPNKQPIVSTGNKKVQLNVMHLMWRPLVKEAHYKSAQAWHALSMDFTVLPAHALCLASHLPTPEGRKAELAYAPTQ